MPRQRWAPSNGGRVTVATGDPAGSATSSSAGTAEVATADAPRRPSRRGRAMIWQPGNAKLNMTIRVIAPIAALLVWYLVVKLGHMQPSLLPSPVEVAKSLWAYAKGTMWSDSVATLRVAVVGLLIGMGIGIVCGLLMGWDRRIRAALSPLVAATFPIPKIAVLSLLVIWFGIGDKSRIVLI